MTRINLSKTLGSLMVWCANAMSKGYESERIYRNDFIRAMHEVEEAREREAHRKSLMDRLLQLAERVMPSPYDDSDNNIFNNNPQSSRRLNDQYFQYEDVNDWNIVGDLAGMAIKYTGCQNIKRWDDYQAMYNEYSPLIMDRFVMFRLCDANSCSAYNKWGCNYNYGEYIIPMEDYLGLMAEYHFQQFSRYCKTCYHCMKLDYYKSDEQKAAEAEAAAAAGDDAAVNMSDFSFGDDYWAGYNRYWGEPEWNDDGNGGGGNRHRRRRAGYSYYKQGGGAANYYYGDKGYNFSYGDDDFNQNGNDYAWYEDPDTGKCIFEGVCTDFRSACKTFNPNATFYENYFTCSKFTVGNNAVYLAPHCRSDGNSIGIGIYSDAYCSDFIGDEVDISDFTGQNFDDGELENYYDKTCLSCSAIDGYSLITDDAISAGEDLTYPLCSVLYQSSAKCNVYAEGSIEFNDDEVNQENNQENVCSFLESLHDKSYNEYGTIVLRNSFDLPDVFGGQQGLLSGIGPLQQIGLVFSFLTFVVMVIYATYLTKKLYYRKPWRPPKSVHSPFSSGAAVQASAGAVSEAGRMSRANSGILQMRSAGETSTYNRDPWSENDDYSRSQRGQFA